MMTEASASPRPRPPYSFGMSAESHPAFVDRKISSGCGAGESIIPLAGVQRDRRQRVRYKISPELKSHKLSWLCLMKASDVCPHHTKGLRLLR
jgi:hypothetical protein